jgi:hypothetical protein
VDASSPSSSEVLFVWVTCIIVWVPVTPWEGINIPRDMTMLSFRHLLAERLGESLFILLFILPHGGFISVGFSFTI